MATICISLYLHQPFILRRYSVFEQDAQYFDMFRSRDACRRLAVRSIYPTNRVLLSLLRHFQGRFRLSLALSGTAIDLLERFAPDALDSFRALVDTGARRDAGRALRQCPRAVVLALGPGGTIDHAARSGGGRLRANTAGGAPRGAHVQRRTG
jgi:hypothetical protein